MTSIDPTRELCRDFAANSDRDDSMTAELCIASSDVLLGANELLLGMSINHTGWVDDLLYVVRDMRQCVSLTVETRLHTREDTRLVHAHTIYKAGLVDDHGRTWARSQPEPIPVNRDDRLAWYVTNIEGGTPEGLHLFWNGLKMPMPIARAA